MSEALGGGVRTFSIGFYDKQYSELPYAKEAAERLHTRHHQEVLAPSMSRAFLEQLAGRFGEPFSDSSALPTWLVSQVAAREVKMVLSGDGGDELFAGYSSYPAVELARKNAALAPIYQAVSKLAGQTRLGAYAAARSGTWLSEHHRRRDTFDVADRMRRTGAATPERPDQPASTCDPVTWCQERDVATYLPDDILTKVDRMSMTHSLEVRVPLLDHKIVEFAFSLPLNLRLRADNNGGFTGKYLLKRAGERSFRALSLIVRNGASVFRCRAGSRARSSHWYTISSIITRRSPASISTRNMSVALCANSMRAGPNALARSGRCCLELWHAATAAKSAQPIH